MTANEWKQVEEKLKSFYNIVKLKCDEYELSVVLERYGQFRNVLMVYVNGVSKGSWLMEDCEERRRFFQPQTRSLLRQNGKDTLKKLPKKIRAEYEAKSRYTYYLPWWRSFGSLKRHIINNNQVIELISS